MPVPERLQHQLVVAASSADMLMRETISDSTPRLSM
jgi:hypothetical protein